MNYEYENAYLRDAKKLPNSVIPLLQNVVLSIREAKSLQDIPNLKIFQTSKNYLVIKKPTEFE